MLLNVSHLNQSEPQQQDKTLRTWSVVFIILTAIFGHTLVFLAMYRERHLRTIPNLIILNLSVADFLFSVIVPTTHTIRLFRHEASLTGAPCYITGVSSMLFCMASINTLTFISIERYMATNYPIRHRLRFNNRFIKITLAGIWCWSVLLSAFPFLTSKYVYIKEFFHCSPDWANDPETTLAFVIIGIVLPQIILVYCNVKVVQAIRKSREVNAGSISTNSRNSVNLRMRREREISIITITVVVTFCVCWAPYCTVMVCLARGWHNLPENFMLLALLLSILNSCCNPIIYGVLNKNFRKAFKNILWCKQ